MGSRKGIKNKKSFNAEETAQALGIDPLEFMLKMVEGDYKYFGFKEPTKVTFTPQGIEIEEPNLKMSDRVACAKESAKYLHSTRQPVDPKTGDAAIRVVIEDYTKK